MPRIVGRQRAATHVTSSCDDDGVDRLSLLFVDIGVLTDDDDVADALLQLAANERLANDADGKMPLGVTDSLSRVVTPFAGLRTPPGGDGV